MGPDGRELSVEFSGDRRAFCVDFVEEGYWLVGRPVGTFSRETTDKVCKFWRVRLIISVSQLLIKRFVFALSQASQI